MTILEYIQFIEEKKPSKKYYLGRVHQSFIRNLSIEDFAVWCNYKREKQRQYLKNWQKNNKAWIQEYRRKNKKKIADSVRDWRYKNKDKFKQINKNSYLHNKEKVLARNRAYYRANRNKIKMYNRAYYIANWLQLKIKRIKGNNSNGTTTS